MSSLFASQIDHSSSLGKFKNRNRMEIVANLLDIAKTATLKTHLMYKANLSYVMVNDYLDYLVDAGLIVERSERETNAKLFETTEKGLKYLEIYASLQNLAGMGIRKNAKSGKMSVL
jgi:predicted transcriptional regulator